MWMKKIRRRKLQSVFIALIIMVCAMLMSSSMTIMTSFKKPYEALVKESNSPVAKIYLFDKTKGKAEGITEHFNSLKEEKISAIPVEYSFVRNKTILNGEELAYFLDFVVYNPMLHNFIRMVEGDKNIEDGECIIPTPLANRENIKVGDSIEIGDGNHFIVKGIYTDPFNMSASYDLEIIVNKMPGNMLKEYYVSVYSNAVMKGGKVIDLYYEKNNILEGRGITLEDRISNNQMTDQILGGILLGMSLIILLISGAMIRFMIKSSLLNDKKTIAIYKTIGYIEEDINGIYKTMYLVVATLGSGLGVLLSKFISDSFTRVTNANLGVTKNSVNFVTGILCIAAILCYVMILIQQVLSKTKHIRPVEVFRGKNDNKKVKVPKKLTYSFTPFAMAVRMINRDKKNTFFLLITCIMSIYCVNFAGTSLSLISNMPDNNYYWIGFDKHDVSVESLNLKVFDQTLGKIKHMKEVKKVIATTSEIPVIIKWQKGLGDNNLTSMVYETFEGINMPVVEGRNPKYSNEISIGNIVANKLNKQIGDYIDIYINGNEKVTLLITGTYQGFYNMGNAIRLLGSTLKENNVDFAYSEASIYLNNSITNAEFIEKYSKELEDSARIIKRSEKYYNIMNMITGPQSMALRPFMTIAILLGGLGIVAIVYMKNKDYSKNYSIYKALGYSVSHLLKVNLCYLTLISVTALLFTVPFFMVSFPKIMVISMSILGFREYPVNYDVKVLLLSNIGALMVFLLCGCLSLKTLNNNPVLELAEE